MSSAAYLTIDGEPITLDEWKLFCEEQGIIYSPQTVGDNAFYRGEGSNEIEITFGHSTGAGLHQPPEDASEVRFSTYFGGDVRGVATLAAAAWKRFGGQLGADPEVRACFTEPLLSPPAGTVIPGTSPGYSRQTVAWSMAAPNPADATYLPLPEPDFMGEITGDSAPAQVYVLVVNDRHEDTAVAVFTNRNDAIAAAERETQERGWEAIDGIRRLGELPEGWLFASNHPTEEDHLQVVAAELREGTP